MALGPHSALEPEGASSAAATVIPPRREDASSPSVPRLKLTREKPGVMRRRLKRDLIRCTFLLVSDTIALVALRELLFGLRDQAWLGNGLASLLSAVLPRGSISSVQLVSAILVGLMLLGTYSSDDRHRQNERLLAASAAGLLLPFWHLFWADSPWGSGLAYILLALSIGVLLVVERALLHSVIEAVWPNLHTPARAIVVGPAQENHRALQHPAIAGYGDFQILDSYDPTIGVEPAEHLRKLGSLVSRHRADTLILNGRLDDRTYTTVVDATLMAGCQLISLTQPTRWGKGMQPEVVWWRGVPLMALTRPSLRPWQIAVKKALDMTAASILLVVLSPLTFAIGVAVKLSSPGPILFRQTRVGFGGRSFGIFKFRSMVVDAERRRDTLLDRSIYNDRRLFKVVDDPRVTPIGSFLRRYSLDELPQLLNVLRGEMSLVGPRPPLPEEVAEYQVHHYARFDVKPGLTGPWQVSGRNLITDFEQVILLETRYIKEWSVWLDFAILLKTIPVVLSRRGAE